MSSNPEPLNKDFPLSIDGYPYVDLHQPLRLGDLHKTFEYSVRQHDAGLFAEFLACLRVKIFHHKSSLIYWYVWHLVLGSLSAKLLQVEEDVTAQTLAI